MAAIDIKKLTPLADRPDNLRVWGDRDGTNPVLIGVDELLEGVSGGGMSEIPDSAHLPGAPTVDTPSALSNGTEIANTAFVHEAVSGRPTFDQVQAIADQSASALEGQIPARVGEALQGENFIAMELPGSAINGIPIKGGGAVGIAQGVGTPDSGILVKGRGLSIPLAPDQSGVKGDRIWWSSEDGLAFTSPPSVSNLENVWVVGLASADFSTSDESVLVDVGYQAAGDADRAYVEASASYWSGAVQSNLDMLEEFGVPSAIRESEFAQYLVKLTIPSGVTNGHPARVGGVQGVAWGIGTSDAGIMTRIRGHSIPKTAGVALGVGDRVYWNNVTKLAVATLPVGVDAWLIGTARESAPSGASSVSVDIGVGVPDLASDVAAAAQAAAIAALEWGMLSGDTPTYDALRTILDTTTKRQIELAGTYVAASYAQIAGTFIRGIGAAPPDDGGVTIVSPNGAWCRRVIPDGRVHTKWFAEISDASTRIMTACATGKRVVVNDGDYDIYSTITVPAGVELAGESKRAVLTLRANATVLRVTGSDVAIRGLKIDGQRAIYTNSWNNGIFVDWTGVAGENVSIEDVTVVNVAGAGIIALAANGRASQDLRIEQNVVRNTGAHGIIAQDYISRVKIRFNTVAASGLSYVDRPGITAGRWGSHIDVSHNTCIGSSEALGASVHGISIDNTSDAVCVGNIVEGWKGFGIEVGGVDVGSFADNTVKNCTRAGIGLSGNHNNLRNKGITLGGNSIVGCSQGIYAFMLGGISRAWMHENITLGVNIVNGTTSGSGIQLEWVDGVSIGSGIVSKAYQSGIYLDNCLGVTVSGATVRYSNCGAVKNVTSLTLSGSTATATVPAHGYSNGDLITIFGAYPIEYSYQAAISNVTTDTFDYSAQFSGLTTPAAGYIQCTKANSQSHGGVRVLFSVLPSIDPTYFGVNNVSRNGVLDYYSTGATTIVGEWGRWRIDEEARGDPPLTLLSSSGNERDRSARYYKRDKLVHAYNNAGTRNFVTIPTDGSTTTWTNSSTTP